jgi:hypothetical protein
MTFPIGVKHTPGNHRVKNSIPEKLNFMLKKNYQK